MTTHNVNDDLQWAINKFADSTPKYTRRRNYYAGAHDLAFATAKFNAAFGALFNSLSLNLCAPVVDAVRHRLKLLSFTTNTNEKAITRKLAQIWRTNRLELLANALHEELLICGDAYVLVWRDANDTARLYLHHADSVVVRASDTDDSGIELAAKRWQNRQGQMRINLYYSDRTEKYVAGNAMAYAQNDLNLEYMAGAYNRYRGDGDGGMVRNTTGRVPVFHFNCRDAITPGLSVQDALNKIVCDMLVASEFDAMRQRWATGVSPLFDDAGNPINPFVPGQFWFATEPNVTFGQFEGADLTRFVTVKDSFILDMARVSGIPPHYFFHSGGTPPSGEALKVSESRLSSKVSDLQSIIGAVWEDAGKYALELTGEADIELDAVWRDTTPRDFMNQVTAAVTLVNELGVPIPQAQAELGYTPEEIARFEEYQRSLGIIPTDEQ